MATCSPTENNFDSKREERRKQVMLGDLPSDFLRITASSHEQQLSLDEQAALALQHHFAFGPSFTGKLTITIVEAKLNKNYGFARMDPYVRLRYGEMIYETHTDHNGARNPRWDKCFTCFSLYKTSDLEIEVFDERAFSLDERIAWANYELPKSVLHGETRNEWLDLSGKMGEAKEGSINIVVSYESVAPRGWVRNPKPAIPVPKGSDPVYQNVDTTANSIPATVQIAEEDLNQVKEMFPNIDEEVIKAVMESKQGNKDQSINALLELSEVT